MRELNFVSSAQSTYLNNHQVKLNRIHLSFSRFVQILARIKFAYASINKSVVVQNNCRNRMLAHKFEPRKVTVENQSFFKRSNKFKVSIV